MSKWTAMSKWTGYKSPSGRSPEIERPVMASPEIDAIHARLEAPVDLVECRHITGEIRIVHVWEDIERRLKAVERLIDPESDGNKT